MRKSLWIMMTTMTFDLRWRAINYGPYLPTSWMWEPINQNNRSSWAYYSSKCWRKLAFVDEPNIQFDISNDSYVELKVTNFNGIKWIVLVTRNWMSIPCKIRGWIFFKRRRMIKIDYMTTFKLIYAIFIYIYISFTIGSF